MLDLVGLNWLLASLGAKDTPEFSHTKHFLWCCPLNDCRRTAHTLKIGRLFFLLLFFCFLPYPLIFLLLLMKGNIHKSCFYLLLFCVRQQYDLKWQVIVMLYLLQMGTFAVLISLFLGVKLPFELSILELSFLLHFGFSWESPVHQSWVFFCGALQHIYLHCALQPTQLPVCQCSSPHHPLLQLTTLLLFYH